MAPRVILPSQKHGDEPTVLPLLSLENLVLRRNAPKGHPNKHHCGFKDCDRFFKSNVDNARHEWTHFTGENEQFLPFPCRIEGCSKKFAQASQRDTHENTVGHGGAAIHMCLCGFAANDNSSLRRHLRPYGENHPEHRRVQPVINSFRQPDLLRNPLTGIQQTREALSPVAHATMVDPAQDQENPTAALPAPVSAPTHVWVHGQLTPPPLAPLLPADSVPAFNWDQYLQVPPVVHGPPFDAVALYHEVLEQQVIAANFQMAAPAANDMARADIMPMTGEPSFGQPLEPTPREYSGMVQDHDVGYNAQHTFQQYHPMNDV